MKRFILLCLVAIMAFSLTSISSAKSHYNPFDDMFKQEARVQKTPNVAKNIFVLFDEQNKQIKAPFSVVYSDKNAKTHTVASDKQNCFVYVDFYSPNHMQILKVQHNGKTYDVIGDTHEDFDQEDITKGEVNYYALKLDKAAGVVHIFDAD